MIDNKKELYVLDWNKWSNLIMEKNKLRLIEKCKTKMRF